MKYYLDFTDTAKEHLQWWLKSGQKKTLQKIHSLLDELREHPTTGTGRVEQLKGNLQGFWSRRIDKESRIVYRINNDVVTVVIVSMRGHYTGIGKE